MGGRLLARLRRDPVLCASALAALISAFFAPPTRATLGYVDFRVLALLFSLMLAVAGLRRAGVFSFLAAGLLRRTHSARSLTAALVGICFFASMVITNDVSLLTFVPFAVMALTRAGRRDLLIPVLVLQTAAANLGSMLTPLGNPQNLYLYSLSGMSVGRFLAVMAPPSALSLLLLALAVLWVRPAPVAPREESDVPLAGRRPILLWTLLLGVCLAAVLRLVPAGAALAAVVLAALLLDRALLREADYGLLLTFVFLFLFTGNIKNLPAVSEALSSAVAGREMAAGILVSQIISNVPAAMLLSGFTRNYSALLLGVNLGGLGTLVASMASVISFRLYAAAENARPARYLAVFTAVNILFLAALWGAEALLT